MCEACSSEFNTIGDNVLAHIGTGQMHADKRYTTSVPKGTMGRGASPTGTMAARTSVKMNEGNGAKFTPQMRLYEQNAAEASAVEKRTYTVPSVAGVGDFWSERARQGQR